MLRHASQLNIILWRVFTVMALIAAVLIPSNSLVVRGASTDLAGPANSGAFGLGVHVLPNGNLVVTDPRYSPPGAANTGAVYLYDGDTHEIISTLTGSQAEDRVGSDGITVLDDGNFIVRSTNWANGAATNAGAVTWCSASSGCSGEVSSANSMVGSLTDDKVGYFGITQLDGSAILIKTPSWNGGAGALTYCADGASCTGNVSAINSLIGSTPGDGIGAQATVLPGEGYVTYAANWDNGAIVNAGAVTGCPMTGCTGPVSTINSLYGSSASDTVGSAVTALSGGGFVSANMRWTKSGVGSTTGAVTYCPTITACNGQAVSTANSLTGSIENSHVGSSVLALPNGDYVVTSPSWRSSTSVRPGAVTYCHVSAGVSDCTNQIVTAANSLIGTHNGDTIGGKIILLANGGYVTASPAWNSWRGAVTFCSVTGGTSSCTGQEVSETNSLVGTSSSLDGFDGDQISRGGVTPLSGGGYVVISNFWDNGGIDRVGAVTYCPPTGCIGPVSTTNSLIGSTANDEVGFNWVKELVNGNYIVMSMNWANGGITQAGAVTFCDVSGDAATSTCNGQSVSAANSLVGSTAGDQVSSSYNPIPLSTGGYLIGSPNWTNGALAAAGAITFCPEGGCTGPITSDNSLLGTQADEMAGYDYYKEVADGYYAAPNAGFSDYKGSVSLCSIETGCQNPISSENSVIGTVTIDDWELYMTFDYDVIHHQLVVGRPAENLVTFFTLGNPLTDTTTELASSSAGGTSIWGETVTLTATVSPAEATGTVDFLDGVSALCTDVALDGSNQATCTIDRPSIGAHTFTAEYSGDENHNGSTSNNVAHQVNKATLAISADDQTKVYGDVDPTFTFQHSGLISGDTIDMIDALPSCTVSAAHVNHGTYTIACSGGSDDHYAFTYNEGALTVNPRPVTVTANPQSKDFGEADPELTYQITSGGLVAGDAFTGELTREPGEAVGNYAILQGTLALSDNYTLTYIGSNLSIGLANTQTSLLASSGSIVYHQSVTLTAGVIPAPPQVGTVSGTVDFVEGILMLADDVSLVDGEAQAVINNLAAGTHEITAIYNGSEEYAVSNSLPVTVVVAKASVTVSISMEQCPRAMLNRPCEIAVSVTSASGTPTGNVTVSDGTDDCVFDLTAANSCELTSTAGGAKTITATYGGDSNFSGNEATAEHTVWYWYLLAPIFR